MTSSESDVPGPHRRRERYRGTHPRRFEEKYKEHAPEDHPGIIEHVRATKSPAAGISRGTFYNHFESVDALLAAASTRCSRRRPS